MRELNTTRRTTPTVSQLGKMSMRLAERSLDFLIRDRCDEGRLRATTGAFSSPGMNASRTETIDDGKALNHRFTKSMGSNCGREEGVEC